MADTYYAWSNFRVPDEDDPNNPRAHTIIKVGDKVSPKDLGYSGEDDPDWMAVVDARAVRTQPYPDMGNWTGSPVEYAKARLAAAAEGENYDDFQYGTAKVPTAEELQAIEPNATPEQAQATTKPQAAEEATKTSK